VVMFLLPREILHRILSQLESQDLLQCCVVCKDWDKNIGCDNEVWFGRAMKAFYEPEKRPNCMDKQQKKVNWKQQFLQLTSPQPAVIVNTKTKIIRKEFSEPTVTKNDKRVWYKADRRNEKTKNKAKTKGQCAKTSRYSYLTNVYVED